MNMWALRRSGCRCSGCGRPGTPAGPTIDRAAGRRSARRAPSPGPGLAGHGEVGHRGQERRGDRRAVPGAGKEIPLPELAPEVAELIELADLLDAFRDDPQVERLAESNHGPGERPVVRAAVGAADELLGDLQDVDLEAT